MYSFVVKFLFGTSSNASTQKELKMSESDVNAEAINFKAPKESCTWLNFLELILFKIWFKSFICYKSPNEL